MTRSDPTTANGAYMSNPHATKRVGQCNFDFVTVADAHWLRYYLDKKTSGRLGLLRAWVVPPKEHSIPVETVTVTAHGFRCASGTLRFTCDI